MGFIIDYEQFTDEVISELGGGARRVDTPDAHLKEKYVNTKSLALTRQYFLNIIGSHSNKSGKMKSGITSKYDEANGRIDIYVTRDALTRPSLYPKKYWGVHSIQNIINLIATGYAPIDPQQRVTGVWHGRRVRSLLYRGPYERRNMPSVAAGWTVTKAANRRSRIGSTLGGLLDEIHSILSGYNLNATISLDDEFKLYPGENRVRTSLYNAQ